MTDLAAELPVPLLTAGTVAPRHTATATRVFLGYAAVDNVAQPGLRCPAPVGTTFHEIHYWRTRVDCVGVGENIEPDP